MTQLEEIKAEVSELRSSVEGLRHENAKLRAELASFRKLAVGAMLGERVSLDPNEADLERSQTEAPTERRLFWAFWKGVGSVLEIYPSEGRFDRWRIKERTPTSEWASLVRDFWKADLAGDKDEAVPPSPGDDAGRENAP